MASLINMIRLVSGDSSDIYYFSSPDFSDFSDVNWDGSATIRDGGINGAELVTVPLVKNDGSEPEAYPANSRFVFKLDPTSSAAIPAGSHLLSIEIKNLALGFRREIVQATLVVTESGVAN